MKIYLVHRRADNNEGSEDHRRVDRVLGVFDSKENAKDAIKNYKHKNSEFIRDFEDYQKEMPIDEKSAHYFPDMITDWDLNFRKEVEDTWDDCERRYYTIVYYKGAFSNNHWERDTYHRYGLWIEEKELNQI